MQRKPLSHTQRVGITASTLALTAILAISQVATGGLFTTPATDSDYRTTPQTNALQLSHNPHAHTPTHSTHTHTHVTGHRPAKKHLHGLTKTQLAEIGKKIGLNTPNLYPQGYPMVSIGDSTMSLAPTTRRPNPFGSCHHYAGAWPQQVSQKLHLPLADLSCSGEVTASYWKKNLGPYLGPRTQLVVISYGSNDMRVVAQLATYNAHLGTGKKVQGRSRKDVEQSLITILKDVRKRAPNALILTVGYLPLVQEKHCVNLPNMTPFENTRVRHLREAADQALTTASKTVARMSEQQWKDNGVEVVSAGISNVPFRQVHGHDLCAMGHKRFILNREKTGVRYHYTEPGLSYIADHVAWKYLSEQLQWSRQMVYLGR